MSSSTSWSQWGFFGIFIAILSYFCYHALYGQRGYLSWKAKQKEFAELHAEYVSIKKEHDYFVRHIKLMQDEIDPDLLTQQAWILLRYVDPDKYVIFQQDN